MPDFIQPLDVIQVLNEAGVRFVLAGLHGIGGWIKKPRATQDVEVVVAARHHKKAVKVLLAAFPNLEPDDLPVVTRLRDKESGEVAIDVMRANQGVFQAALSHTHLVHSEGHEYLIPSLEMALAMKFAPMVSPNRLDLDKHLDIHDFGNIVRSNAEIDLQILEELGEMVYPGGGKEILEIVRKVRAGEKLNI
ncbi:MAG TPA: hypothetical protein VGP68_02600 [Gemmataceae bacterium]|nr:hypothetical protein [Gemmataceae bacterium]